MPESMACHARVTAAVLTDYHVHLRPDEPDTPAERFFTPGNAERYRDRRGGAGDPGAGGRRAHLPLHRRAGGLGAPVLARVGSRRPRRLLRLRARGDRPQARHRGRLRPGREDRMANLLESRDWDFVVGSVHFLRDRSLDTEDYSVWGAASRRRRSGGATSRRSPSRRSPGSTTSSPTPTWSRCGATQRAAAGQGPALLLRAGRRGVRGGRRRGRGLHRRPAQAGRRDLPGAAVTWRWCSTRAARSRSPATRTSRRSSASATRRPSSCCEELGVRELAVFERRQRRMEPIG